jgi:hypothetical protein
LLTLVQALVFSGIWFPGFPKFGTGAEEYNATSANQYHKRLVQKSCFQKNKKQIPLIDFH